MYKRFGLKGLPYMLERAGLDVQQGNEFYRNLYYMNFFESYFRKLSNIL